MADRPVTLFDEILSLTRAIRAAFDLRVKQVDLTFARARLLTTIGRNPGASQSELAQALEIETPTLKRLLDALEGQGLAERRPLQSDARKHAVFLTDTTRIEPLLRFRGEVEQALIEGVAPDDLAATRRVLEQMTLNAERMRQA
ncbi:MarR family winged helix-turn-helix transcriptional regulator [Paracoccus laeviglucosivorans]|uniref:MarR family transcriptional regulator, transcriptional regulator for hemolysin n=1 Tax=Paracoccus laeviglucosivorans TaxID=1197861 RepID=A0A521DUH4_9RHOB|nr:MarR family transcriptional regulator [Paracoccus laeviglucosivorans]SMO74470.1 MarR family transcriptional regulator, transcriptional regulator for hemolysin [Paracoccus laeviglucosivorans]